MRLTSCDAAAVRRRARPSDCAGGRGIAPQLLRRPCCGALRGRAGVGEAVPGERQQQLLGVHAELAVAVQRAVDDEQRRVGEVVRASPSPRVGVVVHHDEPIDSACEPGVVGQPRRPAVGQQQPQLEGGHGQERPRLRRAQGVGQPPHHRRQLRRLRDVQRRRLDVKEDAAGPVLANRLHRPAHPPAHERLVPPLAPQRPRVRAEAACRADQQHADAVRARGGEQARVERAPVHGDAAQRLPLVVLPHRGPRGVECQDLSAFGGW